MYTTVQLHGAKGHFHNIHFPKLTAFIFSLSLLTETKNKWRQGETGESVDKSQWWRVEGAEPHTKARLENSSPEQDANSHCTTGEHSLKASTLISALITLSTQHLPNLKRFSIYESVLWMSMKFPIIFAQKPKRGFPTRMVYLHYISCLRFTTLVGNPRNDPQKIWQQLHTNIKGGSEGNKICMALDIYKETRERQKKQKSKCLMICNYCIMYIYWHFPCIRYIWNMMAMLHNQAWELRMEKSAEKWGSGGKAPWSFLTKIRRKNCIKQPCIFQFCQFLTWCKTITF